MAKARHTYAVRLAVEGGNRVKADLVSVGESGERSMRKIDRGSDRASRGLRSLGDRASTLRSRLRLLSGVLAGVAGAAAVGGLAALVKRSIDAADSMVKTADKLGVGTAALQELRFAANLAGIEQTTLDMALQRFTRRAAEAAKGTGEAKDALKQMGIALKDQHGNMRRSEDLLGDVAEALKNTKDPAERLRLAFKLFDSEGVAMVNMLVAGGDALEATRQRARDLGIVLDEELLRNAEKTKDQLAVLGMVISANVNKAVLEHADAIGDLAERFTESLPTLISWVETFGKWIGLIEQSPEERLEEINTRIAEIDQSFQRWHRTGHRARERRELEAEKAEIERLLAELATQSPPTVTPAATPAPGAGGDLSADDDEEAAKERARRLLQIQQSLNRQLFQLRHQGAERIRAEHDKLVAELEEFKRQLAEPLPAGGTEAEFEKVAEEQAQQLERIERLQFGAAAVRDDKLAALARREVETADRRDRANRRILEGLRAEQQALAMTDRQRFVSQALRRLSAEATDVQRREVRELAGALYDEQQAIEARNAAEREANRLRAEGEALTERLRTAQEAYADEIERLRELLEAGAMDQETFGRASEQAYDRMLRSSREWSDGVQRAIRDYLDEAADAAKQFERITTRALQASEDAFVEWAMTGKFSAKDLFNTIAEEALRAAYRMAVAQPLNNILGTIIGAIGSGIGGGTAGGIGGNVGATLTQSAYAVHTGGVIGRDRLPTRMVSTAVFDNAPRYHRGGLVAGEVPIVARHGEGMFTPGQMRNLAPVEAVQPEVHVAVNVRNTAPGVQASADWRREASGDLTLDIVVEQVEGSMARHIGQGAGLAPTLERRYGLNPAAGSVR